MEVMMAHVGFRVRPLGRTKEGEAQALLNLSLSLAEIAPAVELFGQVEVPDAYDSRRITAIEH